MIHLPILTAFTATNSIPVWDETTPLLATATETESGSLVLARRPAEFSRGYLAANWVRLSNRVGLPPVLGELLGVLW